MGLETILLVFGVVIAIACLIGFAKGRRPRSPTEPTTRTDGPRASR